LVTGIAAFRRGKSASDETKPSWAQTILNGAGMAASLWKMFRAQRDE